MISIEQLIHDAKVMRWCAICAGRKKFTARTAIRLTLLLLNQGFYPNERIL
jgi:hypothetical protein